ncbi:hypothetical protein GCM10010515_36130 [Streptomyces fructofermentans]|uniref:Uncharacterized protein n=1 Tax=Streptomyces fructofermentans TaxID=152141 RepID=A0A918KJF4_9ACTN|nr:hypothetical protein GCM10010515_36130 [Streptomyces fructofermentans]
MAVRRDSAVGEHTSGGANKATKAAAPGSVRRTTGIAGTDGTVAEAEGRVTVGAAGNTPSTIPAKETAAAGKRFPVERSAAAGTSVPRVGPDTSETSVPTVKKSAP